MKLCLSEPMYQRLAVGLDAKAELEIVRMQPDGSALGDLDGTAVFCFSVDLAEHPESLAAAGGLLTADSLEWVQASGAGVEHPMWGQLLDRGVRLTSAAGVHAEPIAQYVFTYVLNDLRQVDRHRELAAARSWEPIVSDDLSSKTIGVVGMGGIGRAVARVGKAYGMRVLGLRRGEIDDPNVDHAFVPNQLHSLLSQCDYVVLAVPLTAATTDMMNAAAFDAMKESGLLINVARGGVVDEPALITALSSRTIRAAVLDVTSVEPLDADSPLWSLENCTVTPHDAGYSPLAGERLGRLFSENLARYLAGDPLINEVYPGRSD